MNLRLKNISLPLAHFVLEVDVEFHGRVAAIFGPSGVGKTSLLEIIAGLRDPTTAVIEFDDHVLLDTKKRLSVPPSRRAIGYVPQDLALFPHLSVRSNLLYGRKVDSAQNSSIHFDRVIEVLEIQPLISQAVIHLSGGEKRRVAIARALLSSPRLLLLDEPLVSLDAALKAKITSYITRVRDEFHIPMLYVTHDRSEALALADEVVLLANGKVLEAGATKLAGSGVNR